MTISRRRSCPASPAKSAGSSASRPREVRFPFEPPREREFDAVGFGLNAVDHLVVVPAYPQFDTKVRFVEHVQAAGGETATAMSALSRLGMRAVYAGCFGSDTAGQFGFAVLTDYGVHA